MPDHEFEKSVKHRMEELRIPPSDPVWERLDAALNRKDKRRKKIFWIPLSVAAACLLVYVMTNLDIFRLPSSSPLKTAHNKTQPENKREATSDERQEYKVVTREGKVKKTELTPPSINTQDAAPVTEPELTNESTHGSLAGAAPKRNNAATGTGQGSHLAKQTRDNQLARQRLSQSTVDVARTTTEDRRGIEAAEYVPDRIPEASSLNLQMADLTNITTYRELNDFTPSFAAIKPKLPAAWQFGFSIAAGRSNLTTGKLNQLFASDMAFAQNSLGQPNAPVGTIYIPPSRLRAGPSFTAGMFAKRNVSRKSSLIVGLQYRYQSVRHQQGSRKDTAVTLFPAFSNRRLLVSGVYNPGYTSTYTNRFHFVELPLSFETRLISGNVPLYWNGGISLSRLISTNALHYDISQRLYYQDNSQFRKTGWNLNTGLSTNIMNKAGYVWTAGPELSYMASGLMADSKEDQRHFFYVGLKSSVTLKNRH